MPIPSIVGYAAGTNGGGNANCSPTAHASGTTGDRVFLMISDTGSSRTVSNANGWNVFSGKSQEVFNTRRWTVAWIDWQSTLPTITFSGADGFLWATITVRPTSGYALNTPNAGASWLRTANGGSINITEAASLSYATDALALFLASETSTAPENVTAGQTLTGTGWSVGIGNKAAAGDSNPINYICWADMSAGGTAATPRLTYIRSDNGLAANSNNGIGLQVEQSQTSLAGDYDAAVAQTFPAFGNAVVADYAGPPVTTGQVGIHLTKVGDDFVTVGHVKLGGTVHETVLYNLAGTVEIDRVTTTHDGTYGRGHATFTGLPGGTFYSAKFEVDGVEQTDVEIISTHTTGTSTFSGQVVYGTCQFTGSNHPIFENIMDLAPDVFVHGGDLHYDDATTEAGWWAGVISSLSSARMVALLERVPFSYNYDNHDLIRTSPLGGPSPASVTAWKQIAGDEGWLSTDTLGTSWTRGKILFIQTDQRSARDNYQTTSEPRKMLGDDQKQAFKDLIDDAATNPAIAGIIWFTTWTARNDNSGRWNDYDTETDELEAYINARPLAKAKMIMNGGDSHVLQADSGARTGSGFRFHGIPSLNISGLNRNSEYSTGGWDIAEADLGPVADEPDLGGYSLHTFDDNGDVDYEWEGIRVQLNGDEDVMASYSTTFESGYSAAATSTFPAFTNAAVATRTVPDYDAVSAHSFPVFTNTVVATRTVPDYDAATAHSFPTFQNTVVATRTVPDFDAVASHAFPGFQNAVVAASGPPGSAVVAQVFPAFANAVLATATGTGPVVDNSGMTNQDLERAYLLGISVDPNENLLSTPDLKDVVYSDRQTPYAANPAAGLSATDVEMAALRAASVNPNKNSMSLSDLRREAWGG